MKNIFRPLLPIDDKIAFIRKNTIGKHRHKYFDFTASGLGFKPIEKRAMEVLKTYANIHSKESYNAEITQKYYEYARKNLVKLLDLSDEFVILPCAFGASGAIKKFQELIGLYIPPATKKRYNIKLDKLPLVIVGPYEHHSNEVSFREALCEIKRVRLDKNGLFDINHFESILIQNAHRQIICSISAASNVTGIITPYKTISNLARKYKALICFDGASSSAYFNLSCKYYDAMYLAPHKLLGGVGSCGLLVMKKDLICTDIAPSFAGGGTVTYVNANEHYYQEQIQAREDAGTPPIMQLIKASLAYQLRNEIGFKSIKKRKEKIKKIFLQELKKIPNCIIYGNESVKTLGIISFNIKHLNAYDLCSKLSTKYHYQTRAGCSCAGPYGHELLGLKIVKPDQKPGWLRVSLHFTHSKKEVLKLTKSIKEISNILS